MLLIIFFPFLVNAQKSNRELSTSIILKNIENCKLDIQLGDKKDYCLKNLTDIGCSNFKKQEYTENLSSIICKDSSLILHINENIFLGFFNDSLIYICLLIPENITAYFPDIQNSEKKEFEPIYCECWEIEYCLYFRFKTQFFIFNDLWPGPHRNELIIFNSMYISKLNEFEVLGNALNGKEYIYHSFRTCGDNKIAKWYNEIFINGCGYGY